MSSPEAPESRDASSRSNNFRSKKWLAALVAVALALGTVIIALNIATLVKMANRTGPSIEQRGTIETRRVPSSNPLDLVSSIRIEEVMSYLNEFQRISNNANGTRAYNSAGFNHTLDYISNVLTANTNYRIAKSYFPVRNFALSSDPSLTSSVNGKVENYNYSADPSKADFYFVKFSTSADLKDFYQLSVIPNVGCTDEDWLNARPSPTGRIALVKRGVCLFRDKAALAAKYNVTGLLFYNDGVTSDRMEPIEISLGQENTVPALFLSFKVGQALANGATMFGPNARVRFRIAVQNIPPSAVGNICADTPSGDPTQTIVIGSHSDSVPAGSGINDNGSGSAANLALAVALARLFRTPSYPKYKYRVRFCWWGAEEVGLLGSEDHVKKAKLATTVGDRIHDYLINLNYDMLGSPNFQFGIYDGRTARNDTPASALPGSNKITALFRDWFIDHDLPWDYTDFSGRSDYGPFLAAGIVAGGLFSGAEDVKKREQRDRYDSVLGPGMGGIPNIAHDPCYHKDCDSIENINVFGYEKMVQAAAYALQYLGRLENLRAWLYPQ